MKTVRVYKIILFSKIMDDMMHDDMMMHKIKRTSISNRGNSGAVTLITRVQHTSS
jgi:hypothetical protein